MSSANSQPLPLPRICWITSGRETEGSGQQISRLLQELPLNRPAMVLIREKQLNGRQLLALASRIAKETLPNGSRLMLSERMDIALAAGLHGVHLPEHSCPADRLSSASPGMLIGKSVHSPESALAAEKEGVDYLFFSPVFASLSKPGYGPLQGTALLREVCRATSVPVFALGGIRPENTIPCIECGAWGVASLGLFTETANFRKTAETIDRLLP